MRPSAFTSALITANKTILFGDPSCYWIEGREDQSFRHLNELNAVTEQAGLLDLRAGRREAGASGGC